MQAAIGCAEVQRRGTSPYPCIRRAEGMCSTPPGEHCPVHCQCKQCRTCPRPPKGTCSKRLRSKDGVNDQTIHLWRSTCTKCNKTCSSKRQGNAGPGVGWAGQAGPLSGGGVSVPSLTPPSVGLAATPPMLFQASLAAGGRSQALSMGLGGTSLFPAFHDMGMVAPRGLDAWQCVPAYGGAEALPPTGAFFSAPPGGMGSTRVEDDAWARARFISPAGGRVPGPMPEAAARRRLLAEPADGGLGDPSRLPVHDPTFTCQPYSAALGLGRLMAPAAGSPAPHSSQSLAEVAALVESAGGSGSSFVRRRLSSDNISRAMWNRDDPPFPIGLIALKSANPAQGGQQATTVVRGDTFVMQVHLLKGSGRLELPVIFGQECWQAARVALSWVMLHQPELERLAGRRFTHDLWHEIGRLDVVFTVSRRFGPTVGSSFGLQFVLCLFAALSGCRPMAKTAVTGQVTLGGKVEKVGDVGAKAQGAVESGMHTIIIPTYNENTAEIRLQTARRLRVQGVATIADGLKHTIEGWRRVNVTIAPPRSALVVMRVPLSYDEGPECETVEVAILPGTGQVHITGKIEDSTRVDLSVPVIFIRAHRALIEEALKRATGGPVSWRFDLDEMKACGSEEARTIDVHIHMPGGYPKFAFVYGPAVVVALVSLMTGLPVPADIGVSAHLDSPGALSDYLGGRLTTIQAAITAGIRRLYVADYDADRLKRAIEETGYPPEVEVIGSPAMPELLMKVFQQPAGP